MPRFQPGSSEPQPKAAKAAAKAVPQAAAPSATAAPKQPHFAPPLRTKLARAAPPRQPASGRSVQQDLEDFEVEEEPFVIDNSVLQSPGEGIAYRKSMRLDDKFLGKTPAAFGSVVCGVPTQDDTGTDWLQVGRFFLPMTVEGIRVIVGLQELGSREPESKPEPKKPAILVANGPKPGLAAPVTPDNGAGGAGPNASGVPQPAPAKDRRKEPSNPLIMAVYAENRLRVERLLRQGLNPNVRDSDGLTPLMIASLNGFLDLCVLLLQAGADAFLTSHHGNTTAELAFDEYGKVLVEALSGCDFEPNDLDKAIEQLSPDMKQVAESVVDKVADQLAARRKHRPEAEELCRVVRENRLEELRTLLRSPDVDVNVRDWSGRTPLMSAAENAHMDACVLLLQAKADAGLTASGSMRAADFAARNRWSPCRELICALSGRDFDSFVFDTALDKLEPEIRNVAEHMIEQVYSRLEDDLDAVSGRSKRKGLALAPKNLLPPGRSPAKPAPSPKAQPEQKPKRQSAIPPWRLQAPQAPERTPAMPLREVPSQDDDEVIDMDPPGRKAPQPPQPRAKAQMLAMTSQSFRAPTKASAGRRPMMSAAAAPLGRRGQMHEVVAKRVIIRSTPSLTSPMLGSLQKGDEIELMDWDETRRWRRCESGNKSGWVMLVHPELGDLLSPVAE